LLRHAGQPIVPTVVAYGQVMAGFDARRLEEIVAGLDERAEALAKAEAEEEQDLRDSEACAREALGSEADAIPPEIEGIDPLPDD
jgi:hypothetical protein